MADDADKINPDTGDSSMADEDMDDTTREPDTGFTEEERDKEL